MQSLYFTIFKFYMNHFTIMQDCREEIYCILESKISKFYIYKDI